MSNIETRSHSTFTHLPVPACEAPFNFKAIHDFRSLVEVDRGWLWRGYLRAGGITLLTSQWKAGKTTLAAVLLAKLREGGSFLGLPLRAGTAKVISEEAPELWLERDDRLQFGSNVRWLCRPFPCRPRPEEWNSLIDHLVREHQREKLDLVVIDPLASFLPNSTENDARIMLDALLPLQRLTVHGVSVLVLHHPKKGESAPGQAARGSGALTGHVDILIEMNWFARPHEDNRCRRLLAFSRYDSTPRRMLIELNPEGTDYVTHGDFVADDFQANWPVLSGVLEEAHNKLTRKAILEAWPDDFSKPGAATLWQWLDRAVTEKRLLKDGSGRKRKPFRYWLPGQEERWKYDSMHIEEVPSFEDDVFDMIDTCVKNQAAMQQKKEQRKQKRMQKQAALANSGVEDGGLDG